MLSVNGFDKSIEFLLDKGYIEQDGKRLTSTAKGTAVAKSFLDPRFFEHCVLVLNQPNVIFNTHTMLKSMEELFSISFSGISWTEGKVQHIMKCLNFDWMRDKKSYNFDWRIQQPRIQWADTTTFVTSRIQKVAQEIRLEHLAKNIGIINYSLEYGVVPYQLAVLAERLEALGISGISGKSLLYLVLNHVKLEDGSLIGPTELRDFLSPKNGVYNPRTDQFEHIQYGEFSLYYKNVGQKLMRYFGQKETSMNGNLTDTDMLELAAAVQHSDFDNYDGLPE